MRNTQMQRGFSVIEVGIIVVVVAVVGLLGWKFYDAQQAKKATVSNVSEVSSVDMVPGDISELADLDTIKKDAIADKQGVTVVHVELEEMADGVVYKAELSDGTVMVYNARTGARKSTAKVAEKTSEALPVNVAASVSFARALEIAKAEKPNSKVYKIELELEGGVVVYSVRFTDKARVDVNAADGSIVRTKAARVETKTEQSTSTATQHGTSTTVRTDDRKTETRHDDSSRMTENDDDDATDDNSDDDSDHSGRDDGGRSGSDSDNSGRGSSH